MLSSGELKAQCQLYCLASYLRPKDMEHAANFCLAPFCLLLADMQHAANFCLASYLHPEDMEHAANFRLASFCLIPEDMKHTANFCLLPQNISMLPTFAWPPST